MNPCLRTASLSALRVLFGIAFSMIAGLNAATLTVTDSSDNVSSPVVGSLRAAIIAATDGDTIDFDSAVTGTITLAGAELPVDKSLTILGPGAATLAVSGNQLSRIFNISAGKTVSVAGLTIRDGKSADGSADGVDATGRAGQHGGAILNAGILTLTDCNIANSTAGHGGSVTNASGMSATGGSGGSGGGIYSDGGSIELVRCTVSGNRGGNGGVWNLNLQNSSGAGGLGGAGGGIAAVGVSVTIRDSTLSNNIGGNGGNASKSSANQVPAGGSAGGGGAVSVQGGIALVERSTFAANSGGTGGGGYAAPGRGGDGGALFFSAGSVVIHSSTVSGNTAGLGGYSGRIGPYVSAGNGGAVAIYGLGAVSITSCTIAGNALRVPTPMFDMGYGSGSGAGIQVYSPAVLSLRNSIVAGNVMPPTLIPGTAPDISGAVSSAGHNLVGKVDGSTGITNGTNGDKAGSIAVPLEPQLRPLANQGGFTMVRGLNDASPAIDAGDDSLTGLDQRGLPRLAGPHVDIGAVEFSSVDILPSRIEFSIASSSVLESAGSAVISVSRTQTLNTTATIQYATSDQSALNGSDFTSTSGTLSFAPGETVKNITVPISNDSATESNESFLITLSPPGAGVEFGGIVTHTVTISDDDIPDEIKWTAAAVSVSESVGNVILTVTRHTPVAGTVGVFYSTSSNSATAGSDFTSTSGTLSFGPGVTQQSIVIPIVSDGAFESDETFFVTLSSPTGGAVLGPFTQQVVTILNDDAPPPPPSVQFSTAARTLEENVGVTLVRVTRSGELATPVSVSYATTPGTAGIADFSSASGTLNFGAFVTALDIAVPITADGEIEGDESFTIALSNPTGGAVLGVPSVHTVTINGTPTVSFANSVASVAEDASFADITVVRTGNLTGAVSVQFATVAGTATEGADYSAASGTLTFGAGVSQRTISVPILADSVLDDGETFTMVLSSPTGASIGGTGSVEVTITDVAPRRNASFHGLARLRGSHGLGGIAIKTTVLNRVSGTLRLNGRAYIFSGPMSDTGLYEKTFRFNEGSRGLTLQQSADGQLITGTFFVQETGAYYDITADVDAVGASIAGAGVYNAVIGSESPQLRGFAQTTVKGDGSVLVRGCVPDGLAFTASTRIAANGNVAMFAPLYLRAKGYIGGTASVASGAFTSVLSWEKPPKPLSVYPAGFDDQELTLDGLSYVAAVGQRVMNDFDTTSGAGNVHFSGGGLGSEVVRPLTYSTTNRIAFSNTDTLITLGGQTGLFKGTFKDASGLRHSLKGIVIPQVGPGNDVAEGFFLNGAVSGFVEIIAE